LVSPTTTQTAQKEGEEKKGGEKVRGEKGRFARGAKTICGPIRASPPHVSSALGDSNEVNAGDRVGEKAGKYTNDEAAVGLQEGTNVEKRGMDVDGGECVLNSSVCGEEMEIEKEGAEENFGEKEINSSAAEEEKGGQIIKEEANSHVGMEKSAMSGKKGKGHVTAKRNKQKKNKKREMKKEEVMELDMLHEARRTPLPRRGRGGGAR
jgi:hypothetical protein